ncbi:hypothetical protein MRX96_037613 [Rhipicephalus microplus]
MPALVALTSSSSRGVEEATGTRRSAQSIWTPSATTPRPYRDILRASAFISLEWRRPGRSIALLRKHGAIKACSFCEHLKHPSPDYRLVSLVFRIVPPQVHVCLLV